MEEEVIASSSAAGDNPRHYLRHHVGIAVNAASGAQVQMHNIEVSTHIAGQFLREMRKIEGFNYG